MGILKQIFCNHDYQFYRNTHGDEINFVNYRTVYQCSKCGKFKTVERFVHEDFNWDELKQITDVKIRYMKMNDEYTK